MKTGLPREIMTGETRVALTPDACRELVNAGHDVYIETGAGEGSGYSDNDYSRGGVQVLPDAESLYAESELIVKVKQPLAQDLACLRAGHILFSYLHLAANAALVQQLCRIGLTAIPFESVTDENGELPLLRPMSRVAGRVSVIRGASLLFRNRGGRGVLLGGVEGAEAGRVVVLGAGVAGSHAVEVAAALGAGVYVVDLNSSRLDELKKRFPAIHTYISSRDVIADICADADLVIGAVLMAGRRAPVVLSEGVVRSMPAGSVIVDIAIDQGGCVEGIRPTDSNELCYRRHEVIHSAVPNMPAATPRTSSQSLSTAVLPYVQALLDDGLNRPVLDRAVAVSAGRIRDAVLRQEVA